MSRVTMADVARVAGVSKQTVSRIVNEKGEASADTIRRVLEVIQELGYRPNGIARSLATRRTKTLGLVLSNLSNPYQAEIAEGAEATAAELGYDLFMSNAFRNAEKQERALEAFEHKSVDGVIVFKPRMPEARLARLLGRHRGAVVIDRQVPHRIAGVIRTDLTVSMALAVEHLVRSGRQTIALFPGLGRSDISLALLDGFSTGLATHGLAFDEAHVVRGQTTVEAAMEAVIGFLPEHPEVDAIVCNNDVVAVGVLHGCRELGRRVPEDIAVIGHGDMAYARLVTPALTTLHVDRFEIGRNAVRMLIDRMAGRNLTTEIVIKPELVVRASAPGPEVAAIAVPAASA
ncbi:MAG: LacI family DNA-binding transcriptional regulator [Trueperaceae bacterium]|nr:LacI family DNA-binding transcriptional regulator [Trueperaceae bacterium]